MNKLKIIPIAAIAIVGVVVSLMIQHKSQVKLHERDALLRQQGEQLSGLTAQHQRLSNLVAHAQSAAPDDRVAELVKLRLEAAALKKQAHDLATQPAQTPELHRPQPAPATDTHPPEFWEQLHQMAGQKAVEARDLGGALYSYASDHQGQFPSNLDQIASYLAKENRSLSGTNHFEIVYQGTLDKLDGIPLVNIAVVRDQDIWPGPDGRPRRVYGMADGIGQIVGSDDNFQAWEAEHIIPPPKAGQSGP